MLLLSLAFIFIQFVVIIVLIKKLNNSRRQFEELRYNIIGSQSEIENYKYIIQDKNRQINDFEEKLGYLNNKYVIISNEVSIIKANYDNLETNFNVKDIELQKKNKENIDLLSKLEKSNYSLNESFYKNKFLIEKNEEQQRYIEDLNKKLTLEFENIANKILENKSEKFTELNKKNIINILEPLGVSINGFKDLINNVYDKESKERFSLGEKLKDLEELNKKISIEALNLTKALKGDFRVQGDWGELVLTNILEKSGLRKDEEYFLQQVLKDQDGNYILSDKLGKKMIPDVIIKYPDNRHIIIDSKVSLNAFLRASESNTEEEYKIHIKEHLVAIKKHINDLSSKGYDDYHKTLDFVLMFIPSEAAYITLLQGDSGLWEYAYEKRILLINPTNLIACLKLISDLWKRESQSQNALLIAERGAKLYDKFVGFIENMDEIGLSLKKANEKYSIAYKQLSSGRDNLIKQSLTLKELGIKNKKNLTQHLIDSVED